MKIEAKGNLKTIENIINTLQEKNYGINKFFAEMEDDRVILNIEFDETNHAMLENIKRQIMKNV